MDREATPIYRWELKPGVPPVDAIRLDHAAMQGVEPGHAHAHDFLVLAYFERGGGSIKVGAREWPVQAGDAFVVAPGEVVGVGEDPQALARAVGWAVSFSPEGLGPQAPQALLRWRAHPLLVPFVRGAATGAQRLRVPPAQRRRWSAQFSALADELERREDGYAEAVVAHLTLLLVDVARLATATVGRLEVSDEPLLAAVFAFIEDNYSDAISLRDVAAAVGLTPGHLTTVLRRRTGRTVQDWIAERRMAQARRLLVTTDQTVAAVGRSVGFRDPVYFSRSFRRAHGITPLSWRRAGRP